jgi:hypothetical protein
MLEGSKYFTWERDGSEVPNPNVGDDYDVDDDL